MAQGNRRERLAGALEEQFGECHSAFSLCMEKAHQAGIMPVRDLHEALLLVKTSVQVASVIARLDPPPRNAQNRGSNPQ
jgi:hypothetical protein